MPYKVSDRTLPMDAPFTLNGYSFGATFLRKASAEDKAAHGIVWEADPVYTFLDKRFYDNRIVDGEVISTPKDLDGLKEKMTGDAKRAAHILLWGSDWMGVRSAEGGGMPSEDWSEWRSDVRDECNRQETQISEAEDVEALANIVQNWPMNPDNVAEQERIEADRRARSDD